jgi:hypothetical protein
MIDCVSVLGIPPPSGQTPLAAVPLSGLPRDQRIGELTYDQVGHLVDYVVCLFGNGYRHDCCSNTQCPYTVPSDPPIGPFRLETVPLIAGNVSTCYATTYDESDTPSREAWISLDLDNFANCHVGLYEDCMRGMVSGTFGEIAGPNAGADPCLEYNDLCGAL